MIALAIAQALAVAFVSMLLRWLRGGRGPVPLFHLGVLAVLVQIASMAWAMANEPARYAPWFYARGGLPRTVQVLATSLGPEWILALAIVGAALYVLVRRPRDLGRAASAALLLLPRRAAAAPDVLFVSASSFGDDNVSPELAAQGTRYEHAYASSPNGIDHDALARRFRALGYEVRAVRAPSIAASQTTWLLFVPIIDTPLARRLAPEIERAAHVGDPALVARDALHALTRPRSPGVPVLLDVRFDATDPPHAVGAPFYAMYTDSAYRGRYRYSGAAQVPTDPDDLAQVRGLHAGAAAAVASAVLEIARGAPEASFVFTADHGFGGSLLGDEGRHVPLIVRDDGEGHLVDLPPLVGIDVATSTHPAFAASAPAPPLGLARYMVHDGRFKLLFEQLRTGVKYTLFDTEADPSEIHGQSQEVPTGRSAALKEQLWGRMADRVDELGGYALPRSKLLSYRARWIALESVDAATQARSVVFTDAHVTSKDSLRELQALLDSTEVHRTCADALPLIVATSADFSKIMFFTLGLTPRTLATTVGTGDIAPTLRELLGLEPSSREHGQSLASLVLGEPEAEAERRAVFTHDDHVRSLFFGTNHLVVRDGHEALYDRASDPSEEHDLSGREPALLEELRARLRAAEAGVPVAGSRAALVPDRTGTLHLRFSGAGAVHRISGTLRGPIRSIEPLDLSRDAYKMGVDRADLAFVTSPADVIGLDVVIAPPDADVAWELYLDDAPWPRRAVFAGCHGIALDALAGGLTSDAARVAARCEDAASPIGRLDAFADLGVLVTR